MSNNTFSWKRFQLLFKQHFIHNSQSLLFSMGAYVGVIFIVLSLTQIGNGFEPHRLENFQGFLVGFFAVFSILYVGYSFPAFRSKESTISYLMLPSSVLEKFVFEVVSRIVFIIVVLPLLYWITFHLQGYFFNLFSKELFRSIGIQHMVKIDISDDYLFVLYSVITGAVLLALSVAFTGAAMFNKQPLVKSLFTVAVIVMFFVGYSFIIIEHVGVGRYNPPDQMMLLPLDELDALKSTSALLLAATVIMLFVAYRKLKEREV